jgi:uncharacterized protein YyaL (SSP411 family)
MLYDQAQLVNAYLDFYLLTKNNFYRQRATGIPVIHVSELTHVAEVLEYVQRVLTSSDGGFYSAEDADSLLEHGKPEHAEGAFYVW